MSSSLPAWQVQRAAQETSEGAGRRLNLVTKDEQGQDANHE